MFRNWSDIRNPVYGFDGYPVHPRNKTLVTVSIDHTVRDRYLIELFLVYTYCRDGR